MKGHITFSWMVLPADEHVLRHRSCEFTFSRGNSILRPSHWRLPVFGCAENNQTKTRQKSLRDHYFMCVAGKMLIIVHSVTSAPPHRPSLWSIRCKSRVTIVLSVLLEINETFSTLGTRSIPTLCSPGLLTRRDSAPPYNFGLLFIPEYLCLTFPRYSPEKSEWQHNNKTKTRMYLQIYSF